MSQVESTKTAVILKTVSYQPPKTSKSVDGSKETEEVHKLWIVELATLSDSATQLDRAETQNLTRLLIVPENKVAFDKSDLSVAYCVSVCTGMFMSYIFDTVAKEKLLAIIKREWPSVQPCDYFVHTVQHEGGEAISIVFGSPDAVDAVYEEVRKSSLGVSRHTYNWKNA